MALKEPTERDIESARRAVARILSRHERFLQANKQLREAANSAAHAIQVPGRRPVNKAVREVQAAARFQCKMLREFLI
jgi:hypothetical protein